MQATKMVENCKSFEIAGAEKKERSSDLGDSVWTVYT